MICRRKQNLVTGGVLICKFLFYTLIALNKRETNNRYCKGVKTPLKADVLLALFKSEKMFHQYSMGHLVRTQKYLNQ